MKTTNSPYEFMLRTIKPYDPNLISYITQKGITSLIELADPSKTDLTHDEREWVTNKIYEAMTSPTSFLYNKLKLVGAPDSVLRFLNQMTTIDIESPKDLYTLSLYYQKKDVFLWLRRHWGLLTAESLPEVNRKIKDEKGFTMPVYRFSYTSQDHSGLPERPAVIIIRKSSPNEAIISFLNSEYWLKNAVQDRGFDFEVLNNTYIITEDNPD